MKTTKLLVVLGITFAMACCGFNHTPKPQDVESNKPLEWDFDLMWKVFMTMPNKGYDMDVEDTIQSVRERVQKEYELQTMKNRLYVYTDDPIPCGQWVNIKCFKYQDADKLFVFYDYDEDCGACNYYVQTYSYDLNDGTLTEVDFPIMPLKLKDFFDEATLAEGSESEWEEMEDENDCVDIYYELDNEKADLLLKAGWFGGYEFEGRDNRLAFDWNGHEFVRKPEADIRGK